MVSTVMMAVLTVLAARSLDNNAGTAASKMAAGFLLEFQRDIAKQAHDSSRSDQLIARVVRELDREWADDNLGAYVHDAFGFSTAWVVDGSGRTLVGYVAGEATTSSVLDVFSGGLNQLIAAARAAPLAEPVGVDGMLHFNGTVHMLGLAPIAPENPLAAGLAAPSRPVLIFSQAIDRSLLAKLTATYLLEDAVVVAEMPGSDQPTVQLTDPNGVALGYLVIRVPTPGTTLLQQVWPGAGLFFIASMLFLVVLFVRRANLVHLRQVELAQSLDQEREVTQLKSQIINTVGHEVRTPLTTIRSATDLLLRYDDRMSEDERAVELAAIQRQVGVISELVEDMLTIGRTEQDAFTLQPKRLDLEALCREIWDQAIKGLDRPHAFRLVADEASHDVALDPALVRAILSNLLGNAIKFSPAGAPIQVEIGYAEGAATIRVVDRGIGIPSDQRDDVFSPFHRASNVGAVSGTGLGLTITKQAVERHGGTISLESREGQGTDVRVRLPAMAEAA